MEKLTDKQRLYIQLQDLKSHQKVRALLIRTAKNQRKTCRYGVVPDLGRLIYDFRHHHIAYCELRGRKREEIESKTAPDNKADQDYIDRIKRRVTSLWGLSDFGYTLPSRR